MNPKWPSIEEQLHAAKVTKGSALEKLIKDNQDFHLLRPEEAHDKVGLPLWLRVHWRKNHPEVQQGTVDPATLYPDSLYRIHQWMLVHQDLRSGAPAAPTKQEAPAAGHGANDAVKQNKKRGAR